jgi:predicted RNase H-like nuclease
VRVLGVDLAWTQRNESGLVALEPDGTISDAGWAIGTAATVEWIEQNATADTLVMVDAPLVVENPAGTQRLCENQTSRQYGRWKAGANSTNLGKPERLAGVQLRLELERRSFRYDDGLDGPPAGGRVVSECYPYTTLVGAAELGYNLERPTYKRPPRGVSMVAFRPQRALVCDELIRRVGALRVALPPLDLSTHPQTRRLLEEPSPLPDSAYKHREDLLDAAISAWTGALWLRWGFERCQVLGDGPEVARPAATIIAPARPEQRAPGWTPAPPPGAPRAGVG